MIFCNAKRNGERVCNLAKTERPLFKERLEEPDGIWLQIVLWAKAINLLIKIVNLLFKVQVLRFRQRQVLRKRSYLLRKQRDLLLQKVNYVFAQSVRVGNADNLLNDFSGVHGGNTFKQLSRFASRPELRRLTPWQIILK